MNATIEFIKQHLKPLSKALIYICGPFILISSIFTSRIFSGFMDFSLLSAQNPTTNPLDIYGNLFSTMGIELVLVVIFALLGYVMLITTVNEYFALYDEKKTNQITVPEVWERVKNSFWLVLGTLLLYTLLLGVSATIMLIPVGIFSTISPFLMILAVFGLYGVIIYISISLSPLFFIRTYEKAGFMDAVKRSFYLVKGKWWSTFGLLLVTGIIQSLISSIFLIPWYVGFIVNMMHNIDGFNAVQEPSLGYELFSNTFLMLYMFFSVLLYCIPLIALIFQYFNLVELKEARGLMHKIDTLGSSQTTDDDEEHY